jgi:hypothetical protein
VRVPRKRRTGVRGASSWIRPGIADAVEAGVQGTITSRDVLLHSVTILRLWGPAFYVRCLRAIASGRACTFLEILAAER